MREEVGDPDPVIIAHERKVRVQSAKAPFPFAERLMEGAASVGITPFSRQWTYGGNAKRLAAASGPTRP